MSGVRDRLRSIDWRDWLLATGIGAIVTGVMKGIDSRSVAAGLDAGVFAGFGVGIFSLMFGQCRRDEILPELSDSDRARVLRTVREGSVVGDARLAPAVIAYTETLRGESNQKWASPRADLVLSGLFALVGLWFAIKGHVDGNDAANVLWTLLAALTVASAVMRPRRRERKLQRLDRVESSARAFVETPW